MFGKLKKCVGFSLLPIGFVFLFEPSYVLLDPIPDFLGYFIICLALINLADINPMIMESVKKFGRAAVLSVLRLITFFVLNFALEGKEQTITTLLFVFVFAVLDAITLIPAFKHLFSGLLYLGMHHDGEAVYFRKNEKGANASERLYGLLTVFVILKNALWALPEFTSLAQNDTYEFVGVLRAFAAIILAPISMFCLFKVIVYLRRVLRDNLFIENLSNLYREKTENSQSFFTYRRISFGLIGLTVSFILSFDLFFDNVNVVSDAFMYAIMILAFVMLKPYSKKWLVGIVTSALGVMSAVSCHIADARFFEKFVHTDVIRDIDAYNAYYFMLSVHIVEAVLFLAVLTVSLVSVRDVFRANTDLAADCGEAERKLLSRVFAVWSVITAILGALAAAGTVFYFYSLPLVGKQKIFDMSNVICMAISIVFAFSAWYFIGYVKGAVKQHCKTNIY